MDKLPDDFVKMTLRLPPRSAYLIIANRPEDISVQRIDNKTATDMLGVQAKLQQREHFIYQIMAELENSNSKSAIVSVLLNRCREQINSMILGVI